MVSSREDFLTALLNCGILDLKLIDDVGYDWYDILDSEVLEWMFSDGNGQRETLNYIMRRVVEFGIGKLNAELELQKDYLMQGEADGDLSECEKEKLEKLKLLDPWEDIESYHNCADTHVWFEKNADVYRTYLQEALDAFAEGTGFEIRGD